MEKFEVPQIQVEILQSLPDEVQEYFAALQTYLQNLQNQVIELQT